MADMTSECFNFPTLYLVVNEDRLLLSSEEAPNTTYLMFRKENYFIFIKTYASFVKISPEYKGVAIV